jgi:DNA replication protein DnaC
MFIKKLHLETGLAERAKELGNEENIAFLLRLLTAELDERERNRRNLYMKFAKFDILKTFENYTFEDIKFPKSITADDIKNAVFIPKKENLIFYGNVGTG